MALRDGFLGRGRRVGPLVLKHQRHSRRKQDLQRDIESTLKSDVPLDQLQTHLFNCFGTDEIAKLEESARKSDADPTLYKAMQLAERYPKVARSLVKHWDERGSQRSYSLHRPRDLEDRSVSALK